MRIGLSAAVMQRNRLGEAQHVLALVRALLANNTQHNFFLFVLADDLPTFAFASTGAQLIPVDEFYRPRWRNLAWHQIVLPRRARDLKLDVLHVPTHRRLLWRRPCPLVGTIHNLASFRDPPPDGTRRRLDPRPILRQVAARQDELVAVSRTTAEDLIRLLSVPPGRITIVPNGVDHQRFNRTGQETASEGIARRYGIQPPFFLYVAQFEHPAKNHVRLIRTFNHFKTTVPSPWQLVLLGETGYRAAAIHDAVRRSPYAQDIHCPGYAAPEELPTWYRAAGAFVFPAKLEGFGLPALEAMACGCPVLAPATGAVAEICGEAGLFADPDNIDEFSRQLARLAADPDLRARLGAAGQQHAQRFDWGKTAVAMLDIYARAARGQNAPVLVPHATATIAH